ncbi:polysaccharide biosynthesis/export family protein [Salipiger sp. PrR003]|uniref:polysaccharide biosynthesis/export family protein n=1 Tax=Salipiger sp. PrR003 TaxID=2706776 RepID=UPI0013DC779E|nr:polysaccharide export protein [Salipiger sp. PrR003]
MKVPFKALVVAASIALLGTTLGAAAPENDSSPVQEGQQARSEAQVEPYGASLFRSTPPGPGSAITDPNRLVSFGDRILLRIWGAQQFENLIMVDAEGNLFIPDVGPVKVSGKRMSEVQASIKAAVSDIYRDNVSVYATLADVNPISVYVAGNVVHPGRFEGTQNDTVLDYIIRAGGIHPGAGSYRDVDVRRGTFVKASYDFYDFMDQGILSEFDFQSGDTIIVNDRRPSVTVAGGARNTNAFEFAAQQMTGKTLVASADPLPGTTHALVRRTADSDSKDIYLLMKDFSGFQLKNGDEVYFTRDAKSDTITVAITGAVEGQKNYALKKGASLKQLLSFIAVDPSVALTNAIHIERASVARAQKLALNQSLQRLQKEATARSTTGAAASIRASEAQVIRGFVESASQVEFPGKVILARGGQVSDIILRDGDRIVIPEKSDVVTLTGEVLISNAFVFEPGLRVKDYVMLAGGLSGNADRERFIVNHPNGSSQIVGSETVVANGDQIIALPKLDTKGLVMAKDVLEIVYQLAMTANAVVFP